jgi:hypothetical protein
MQNDDHGQHGNSGGENDNSGHSHHSGSGRTSDPVSFRDKSSTSRSAFIVGSILGLFLILAGGFWYYDWRLGQDADGRTDRLETDLEDNSVSASEVEQNNWLQCLEKIAPQAKQQESKFADLQETGDIFQMIKEILNPPDVDKVMFKKAQAAGPEDKNLTLVLEDTGPLTQKEQKFKIHLYQSANLDDVGDETPLPDTYRKLGEEKAFDQFVADNEITDIAVTRILEKGPLTLRSVEVHSQIQKFELESGKIVLRCGESCVCDDKGK